MTTQQQINESYEKTLKSERIGAWGNTIILTIASLIWACFNKVSFTFFLIGFIILFSLWWFLGINLLIKTNKKLKEYNEFKNNLDTEFKGEIPTDEPDLKR